MITAGNINGRKKGLANSIQTALSFCDGEGFKPCSVEIENVDTGVHGGPYLKTRVFFNKSKRTPSKNIYNVGSALYVKERFFNL